ncbi:WD repeat domain-containing protein 83 [Halotydeus destructor]|nr:WD repeat domain-containing protein 83 [Halotydeus destructor]
MNKTLSFDCKQKAVRAVRFNADGVYCLTCGSDKTLKLWNPRKSLLLSKYEGHGDDVLDAQGSHDSGLIVSCGVDKFVLVWDVSTGKNVRRIRAHPARVNCVKFNEDASVAISGSVDGTVKVWDLRSKSWEPIQSLDEAKDSVTSLCVSEHEIASGSLDGKVRRYDLRKGVMSFDDCSGPVGSVMFTKDGQSLLVNTINSRVKVIDKFTGEVLAEFKGHNNQKYKVEGNLISNDSIVVSGSEDGQIYMWNLIEGSITGKLFHEGHRVVHSLDTHPSGKELVSASEGSIYLWTLKEEDD